MAVFEALADPREPGRAGIPLVSCVIIFLDEEKYLEEAIDSVLAQTFADWELLLVDDGSSDRSGEISRRYADRDPARIRYLQHPGGANRGMSASRNLGIEQARGTYLAFLDGDDAWLPGKLASQVDIFAAQPQADMVCGATIYWHSWDESSAKRDNLAKTGDIHNGPGIEQDRLYEAPSLMTLLYPLGWGATPSTSGFMVKRDFTLEVGCFVNHFRGLYEDQVFLAKMFLNGCVYVASTCFDKYRQHPESCVYTAYASGRARETRKTYLSWLTRYLAEQKIQQRDIHRALFRRKLRENYPPLVRVTIELRRRANAVWSLIQGASGLR